MQHSLADLHGVWSARYVHPSPRARERRLGLGAGPRFVPAPSRHTVLRQAEMDSLTALRARWRTPVIEPGRSVSPIRQRQAVAMSWTRTARVPRPSRVPVAPAWRG